MATPCAIYNHPELYFRDGNVILSAYSTNEENKWDKCAAVSTPQDKDTEEDAKKCVIRFRVHKSLLSMHSKIMEDMFLLPQSQSSIQYDEDTERVEMPDSAEEIEAMLSVIYGRGMFTWYGLSLSHCRIRLGNVTAGERVLDQSQRKLTPTEFRLGTHL